MSKIPALGACLVALASTSAAAPVVLPFEGPGAPTQSPADAGLSGTFPGTGFGFTAETGEFIPEGEVAVIARVSTNVTGPDLSVQALTIDAPRGQLFELRSIDVPSFYSGVATTLTGFDPSGDAVAFQDTFPIRTLVSLSGTPVGGGTVEAGFVPVNASTVEDPFAGDPFFSNPDPTFGPEAFGSALDRLVSLTFTAALSDPLAALCDPGGAVPLDPAFEEAGLCGGEIDAAGVVTGLDPAGPLARVEIGGFQVGPRNDDAFYELGSLTVDVAPIPVPASLPLLAGGLGALAWTARRRARRGRS